MLTPNLYSPTVSVSVLIASEPITPVSFQFSSDLERRALGWLVESQVYVAAGKALAHINSI